MVADKSLFFYGRIYHAIIDPMIKASWQQIVTMIPENSRVFDAGCGTGGLALLLAKEKNCKVVAADLSLKQLHFAKRSGNGDVKFVHMDVSDISEYGDDSFDYSVMCQVIHEIPAERRPKIISEIMRIAKRALILDSNTPLPWNYVGLTIRFMDATFGRDHYDNFKSYLASGGMMGILERAGLTQEVAERSLFRKNCQQIVTLTRRR